MEEIKIGDKDSYGRELSERFIHFWNNTSKEQVENVQLKKQVSTLIETTATVRQLSEQLQAVNDNTQFVKNVYTKTKTSNKKVSPKKLQEQKTLSLMERMMSRGKKV